MKNNTIVTIGDINYLWGIFMMIASLRKAGMDEPVLVGTKKFTPEACDILTQMGDVSFYSLDSADHSLTCYKGEAMLQANTDFITWVDSDAFFWGNCSALLTPETPDRIHVRMRSYEENPMAFRNYTYGEDGHTIPRKILEAWKHDLQATGEPVNPRSCSACFLAVHASQKPFLKKWQDQMMTVLPKGNVGVVDRSLDFYHQLDESVLNSVLNFWPGAPHITDSFKLDKDPEHCYIHFVGQPKPWIGWPPSAFRHFDRYVAVADFAQQQGWKLPSELPYCLKGTNKSLCRLLQHPINIGWKIRKRLKAWF